MRSKEEYSDKDIIHFQSNVDDFFEVWVALFSSARCTNYIHFLASGTLPTTCLGGVICNASHNKAGRTLILF
jgi:hypothetical protein